MLPSKPAPTPTGVNFRYSFYSIPFEKDGENVFIPTATAKNGIAKELFNKGYLKYEVITDRPFRSEQESIVLPQNNDITTDLAYTFNYCRVAITRDIQVGLHEYTYDANECYYWIDNTQFLSIVDDFTGGAIQFDISKDYMTTNLMINRLVDGEYTPNVKGIIDITNYALGDEFDARALAKANLTSAVVDQSILSYDIPYALIVCYTGENGLYTELIDCNEDKVRSNYDNLIVAIEGASKFFRLDIGAEIGYNNISVKKIYALPLSWVEEYKQVDTRGQHYLVYKYPITGVEFKYKSYYLASNLQGNVFPVYIYSSQVIAGDLWTRHYLKLPSKLIEFKGNPSSKNFYNISIYLDLAGGKGESDSIVIRLFIDNEYVDISDAFTVDFAVNENALRQNQFKELAVLEGLSAGIGAIGGVAGGIASGNYFGAVQSLVGGVEKIGNLASAPSRPAQLRSAGSFLNGLEQYGVISILSYNTAVNVKELDALRNNYGWTFDNPHILNLKIGTPAELDGKYFKFKTAYVSALPRKSSYAEGVIANKFIQGVRFKTL